MHDEAGADVHFHRVSPSGRVAAPPRGASWIFRGRGRVDGYDGAPAIACAFSRRPATRPRSKTVLIMRVVPLVAARRPGFSDAPHPHEATRARLAPADRTSERRRFRQRWRLEGRSKRPTGIRCHPVAAPAAAAHVVETTAYGFAAFDVLAAERLKASRTFIRDRLFRGPAALDERVGGGRGTCEHPGRMATTPAARALTVLRSRRPAREQ